MMSSADWEIQPTEEFERLAKTWLKRHRRELHQALQNLDALHKALNAGALVPQARQSFGFVHDEPGGIIAIDQKGAGKGTRETRLYVWLDGLGHRIHLIRIGDKGSQDDDIRRCSEWLREWKRANKRRLV